MSRLQEILDFTWIIENEIAACAHPLRATNYGFDWEEIVKFFQEQKISAVITLAHEWPLSDDEIAVLKRHNIDYLFIPIRDFSIPRNDSLIDSFLNYTRKLRQEKKAFLVHCYAGCGRTGLMTMIYLMDKCMTLDEAFEFALEKKLFESREDVIRYLKKFYTKKVKEKISRNGFES